MRRTLLGVGFCLAVALGFASPARAATLTITDTFGGSNTVWTLDVATGCTTCAVTITAQFQDPDGAGSGTNGYTGTFIDAVQWLIAGPDPTAVTVLTAPSSAGFWVNTGTSPVFANLNSSQCGGGSDQSACVQTDTALGFGPIVNGSTLTWTFSETFASALNSVTTGNIRAAFNNADGSNFNIFSPNGGTFTGTGTGTGTSTSTGTTLVPEPTSLLLFGSGLSMAAYRARRKKQNQKNS